LDLAWDCFVFVKTALLGTG